LRRVVVDIDARVDAIAIVNTSVLSFGRAAAERYSRLITQSYADLATWPERPGARWFEDDVYLYHLRWSRRTADTRERVARPRHLVVYRYDADSIQVLRLLHDRMDVRAHVRSPGD
jgi:toxin ParE1/3/4